MEVRNYIMKIVQQMKIMIDFSQCVWAVVHYISSAVVQGQIEEYESDYS